MSKKAVVTCTIKETDPFVLKRAVEKMLELLKSNGRIQVVDKNKIEFFARELAGYGNIILEIKNGQLSISCEEENIEEVKNKVEMFYKAAMFEELPNASNIEMENEELLLSIEV